MAKINGTSGADSLIGTMGADTINGRDGDDTIDAGSGVDVVNGGAGDDLFRMSALSAGYADSTYDGGAGFDIFDYGVAASQLFFQYSTDLQAFTVADNVVKSVERLIGGSGPDIFSFANLTAPIEAYGGDGGDHFFGGSGAELFHGGSGDDDIWGGPGDRLYGDDGADTYFVSGQFGGAPSTGVIDGGAGIELLKTNILFNVDLAAGTAVSGQASFAVAGIENVMVAAWLGYGSTAVGDGAANLFSVNPLFDDGTASVVFSGDGGADTLTGSAARDSLQGDRRDDRVEGRHGADTVSGGAGRDSLLGGSGADRITGGGGADILSGGAQGDRFIFLAGDSTASAPDLITDLKIKDIVDLSGIDADGSAPTGILNSSL
ncbi:MAG: calcium-binding protein [Caulobacteraceae bacterium]